MVALNSESVDCTVGSSSSSRNNGPGFWSGMAAGGLLGSLFSNRKPSVATEVDTEVPTEVDTEMALAAQATGVFMRAMFFV